MEIETLRAFLGWCTVVNFALLALSAAALLAFKDTFAKLHARMFGLSEDSVRLSYYVILAGYKLAIIVLNLVPYLVLRLFL